MVLEAPNLILRTSWDSVGVSLKLSRRSRELRDGHAGQLHTEPSILTDSVSRGMPDNQSVDYSTRISGVNDIFNVTTKPLIFDIDNGGQIEHLPNVIRKLERAGFDCFRQLWRLSQ